MKEEVDKVCVYAPNFSMLAKNGPRINCQLLKTFETKRGTARLCLSGLIVIARVNILAWKSVHRREMVILELKSDELDSATQKERKSTRESRGRTCRTKQSLVDFSHVLRAAREPITLDELQANAVAARIELDLRIGAAFTRLQTLQLQAVAEILKEKVISYGTIHRSR